MAQPPFSGNSSIAFYRYLKDDISLSHNGDKEERCYVSGRLDGTAKYYYASGAVESRIYENGILQGMRRLEHHRYFIIRYQLLEFC